ncbi:MAG: 30S ribosomal protein S8e [Candidatus Hydrothermarchaeales archaeon]
MSFTHLKSKKKKSGGLKRRRRTKRKFEIGSGHPEIKIGGRKTKVERMRGGKRKIKLMIAEDANILDPKTKESKKVKILKVLENSANPHYVRRNIITKGAIIETEIGKAKVTSRLGQDGNINGILLS